MQYDQREALLLRADLKEKVAPNHGLRADDANTLLSALRALNGKHGFCIEKDGAGVHIIAPGVETQIENAPQITYGLHDGSFNLYTGADKHPIHGLEWDHRSRQWRGPRRPVVDGKPTHRSALAVLLAAVLGLSEDAWRDMHEDPPKEDEAPVGGGTGPTSVGHRNR